MKRVLASWFGTGLILGAIRGSHMGSGTVAAAITFPAGLLVSSSLGWQAVSIFAVIATLVGVWAARPFVEEEGDAGWIVVDEAAGTLVAVIGLTGWPALVGWAVFRLADIFKSWFPGVRQAEGIKGVTGVMADDLVAGAYGLLAGHIVLALT